MRIGDVTAWLDRDAARATSQREERTSSPTRETAESRNDRPPTNPHGADGKPLTDAEAARLTELRSADREVRAHELAHQAAGGGLARGMSLSYVTGPDGRRYAVAGEVSIDSSTAATPEATIAKMQQVRAAALAPANPSPQDRAIAARATMSIVEASMKLVMEQRQAAEEVRNKPTTSAATGISAYQNSSWTANTSRVQAFA